MSGGTFYIETLGCPKNQVDSEALRHNLISGGLKEVKTASEANLIFVNTCTFIKEAKEETLDEVLSLAQQKRPGQKLVMFGCMVQRYRDVLKKELPEVDYFFGFEDLKTLFEDLKIKGLPEDSYDFEPQTYPYAYLKIAEGCQRTCSFCVIPSVRGPLRSIHPDQVIKRAEYLIHRGYRELILIAQDITSYGKDLQKGYGLKELLRDLLCIEGQFQIRLLYLYPGGIDEDLLEMIAEHEKICPYLDIPLQHTEKRILRLMGRAGDRKVYTTLIDRARSIIKDLHLRTAFIVGFPTERKDDFQNLLSFVQEIEFDHLGAFIYSDEEGTEAYGLRPKVPEGEKRRRYDMLMSVQAEISKANLDRWIGRKVKVLVDTVEDDIAVGRHPGQAPEIDGVVIIKDPQGLRAGQFVEVLIEDSTTYDLVGRVC